MAEKKPFRPKRNRGRMFPQRRPDKSKPSHKGKMDIDGDLRELTFWENPDRTIDVHSETIEQAEAMRAKKGKKNE